MKTAAEPKYEKISTPEGTVFYAAYEFGGQKYQQRELTVVQMQELLELLAGFDFPIADVQDIGTLNIGQFVAAVIKQKAVFQLLSILLMRPSGERCAIDEFRAGKAADWYKLTKVVLNDFFSLNDELGRDIRQDFQGLLGLLARSASVIGTLSRK